MEQEKIGEGKGMKKGKRKKKLERTGKEESMGSGKRDEKRKGKEECMRKKE